MCYRVVIQAWQK